VAPASASGAEDDRAGPQGRAAPSFRVLPVTEGDHAMSRYAKQPDHGSKGPAARREDCPEQADSRPPVQRLEYLFEVTDSAGATRMICDPAGPRTRTPFGDHWVLEFPGYREPACG
jgi:hypothetical protein